MAWIKIYIFFSGPLFLVTVLIMAAGILRQAMKVHAMTRPLSGVTSRRQKIIPPGLSVFKGIRHSLAGRHPVFAGITFMFHFCLFVLPLFISAHAVLIFDALGLRLPQLPSAVSHWGTRLVILGGVFFLGRRIFSPVVRYLSHPGDFVVLAVAIAPFVTGLCALHHVGDYTMMMALHAVSGNVFCVAIGWSRLGHGVFFLYSRFAIRGEYALAEGRRRWHTVSGGEA